jgi:hypothetical protein
MKPLPDWTRTWPKVPPPTRAVELGGQLYVKRGGCWYHGDAPERMVDGVRTLRIWAVCAPKVLLRLRRLERRGEAVPLNPKQKKLPRRLRRKLERGQVPA